MSEEELYLTPLKLFLHRYGINLRFCGLFLTHLSGPRQLYLVRLEIAARTAKHHLRAAMRAEMKRTRLPHDGTMKRLVVGLLNQILEKPRGYRCC